MVFEICEELGISPSAALVVGDTTHGKGAHNRAVAQWLGISRLWLHACRVEVPAPHGVVIIEAPPDLAWQCLLADIKTH